MTARCSSRCWRPTPRCVAVADDLAGLVAVPRSCTRTGGYDYHRCRTYLHRRGIKVRIARRGIEDKSKLGRARWVIERTISWLLRFKRLGLRYDCTERTTLPLLTLACAVINVRRLIKSGF